MCQVNPNNTIKLFEEFCKQSAIDGKDVLIKIGNIPILAKVASTPKSQALGFSSFPKPDKNCGLLFVYDESQPLSFWMKGVDFPLDIIFFDDEFKYINHHSMLPEKNKSQGDLTKYLSNGPAKYAVELSHNWCRENLKPNYKLTF